MASVAPRRASRVRRRAVVFGLAAITAIAAIGVATAPRAVAPGPSCTAWKGWDCRTLEVPVRHATPGPTMHIAYAVHEATNPPAGPRRVLVFAAGGPGVSGIDDARFLPNQLDPDVVSAVDLVAFDPRGIARSEARDCPDAAVRLLASDQGEAATARFVSACIDEAGATGLDLAVFGTTEVVEDVESIRVDLGVERIVLYGSSYGTVTAQAYAVAHPDRVEALVLDAPVDRTIPPAQLWVGAARGYLAALEATLHACDTDPDCEEVLPDAAATFERLAREVDKEGELSARVVGSDGTQREVTIKPVDLDSMAGYAMYSIEDREALLRALARYAQGDLRPLARLVDSVRSDGTGTFGYFATWCADVRVSPGAAGRDLAGYRAARRREALNDRTAEFIADALAPCVYWPAQPATWVAPPDPAGVKTLVLTTTLDPVTLSDAARAIVARIAGSRLVATTGGGHGSLGERCPQAEVTRLVLDGTLPDRETTLCHLPVIDAFVPLAPRPAESAADVVLGLVWETAAAPELVAWDGSRSLSIGCGETGTITLTDIDGSWTKRVHLERCAMVVGAAVDGTGTIDLDDFDAHLEVRGTRGWATLDWTADEWRLTGRWDGHPVNEDE